jgi:hypothetical protein
MAIDWQDKEGHKGTVKCPRLMVEAMRLRHLSALTGSGSWAAEDSETDCIGDQCGAFAHCTGRVSVDVREFEWPISVYVEGGEALAEAEEEMEATCPVCSRRVKVEDGHYVVHTVAERGKKQCRRSGGMVPKEIAIRPAE